MNTSERKYSRADLQKAAAKLFVEKLKELKVPDSKLPSKEAVDLFALKIIKDLNPPV